MKLENKVAIVTGGAMGNGLGIVKVFLKYGAKVAIFDYRTGKVIEELNVYTYSLPQSDRTYLENGIMLYTVSELISLIEDYTG